MSGILLALLLSVPVEVPGLQLAELHRPGGQGPCYLVLRVMPGRGERPAGRDAMHAVMTGPPNERTLAGLRAAVSWYGSPPAQPPAATPALAFFGGQDMGPSLEDARRFEGAARASSTKVHIYPEAQHGFADPQNPWGGYDAKAAEDSWARAVSFVAARLEAKAAPDAHSAASGPRAAVDCVIAAWNAYDVEASRKCYVDGAVSRNAHGVVPIDWDFERNLRAFDRVARSRFRAEVRQADGASIEYRLHETNDFLTALRLDGVSAIWRYTVKDGRVTEEDLMEADGAFRTALRKFSQWGRTTKPAGWDSVVDSEGIVRFDGSTAEALIRLAKEWSGKR